MDYNEMINNRYNLPKKKNHKRNEDYQNINNNKDEIKDLKREFALQTEALNKILKELTILNDNLEKMPSMYSTPPIEPRNPNPLNILNKFDFDMKKLSEIGLLILDLYKKEDKNEDKE